MRPSLPSVALAFAFLVAAGCGGGGGSSSVSSDRAAPTATLQFPPNAAVTDADAVTVRGSAQDPSGVATVAVNGTLAASADGFATFTAVVPLAAGDDALRVDAIDGRGNRAPPTDSGLVHRTRHYTRIGAPAFDGTRLLLIDDERGALLEVDPVDGSTAIVSDATVGQGAPLGAVQTLAIDPARGRALTGDFTARALIAVDPGSGDRAILSDATHGAGTNFTSFAGLCVDPATDLVFVSDSTLKAFFKVSLVDGDRKILSDASHGSGPALDRVAGMALDVPRSRLLAVNSTRGAGSNAAVLALDPTTGDRTIVSDSGHGAGPAFRSLFGLAADPALGFALVLDSGPATLYAVDLVTGDRSELSGPNRGSGIDFDGTQLALDLARNRVLVTSLDQLGLIAVDLSSGDRTLVGEPIAAGSGPGMSTPVDVDVDPELALAAVADATPDTLLAIDLHDGSRRVVADDAHGSGPALQGLDAVVIDSADARLLVADHLLGALVSVDLASGDRTIVSDLKHGVGPLLGSCGGMTLDAANERVLWQGTTSAPDDDALLAISVVNGDRTVLSSKVRGSGPTLTFADGLALDAVGERAFVVSLGDVIAIDLATGDRSVVADPDGGAIHFLGRDLASDPARGRLLVLNFSFDQSTLVAVDLATGKRTTVTAPGLGVGPRLLFPRCVAVDRAAGTALVGDSSLQGVVAVDLNGGDRALQSR